jgi:alkylation response protein AidB-like acyl-CoA dehydrogenase
VVAETRPVALDTPTILARARALHDAIRAEADRIERERRIPDGLLAALGDAGVFRIAMPRAWGGPEMDPCSQIELIEALARADASVGWCASILSDSGFYGAFLDEEVARELYAELDMRTAGMLAPVGRAELVDGGYRVNGRWAFGSGSLHADWITGGCLVTRDGEPIIEKSGLPRYRILFFPPSRVEIHDTWYTTGLAGSGSHDYTVRDLFVPAERCFDVMSPPRRRGPLYAYHGLFFANVPGVPLGLARAAIDEIVELARTRVSMPSLRPLREEYRVQVAVAEAEGVLGSARSYAFDVMGDVWETLTAGRRLSLEQRAKLALMMIHTGRSARRVVDLACEAAGSVAIYRSQRLERLRRDAITVGAHVVHQAKTYESVGQALLGLEPRMPFF